MELKYLSRLAALNQLIKEADDIYHSYAKRCRLSDSAFCVLYSLWENEKICSQRELCSEWFYSPQTVNSALKGLEKRGYIKLEPLPNAGKNKQITFTDEGRALAEGIIPPLVRAELSVFSDLGERECEALLALARKYVASMRENINRISKNSSED